MMNPGPAMSIVLNKVVYIFFVEMVAKVNKL